MVQATLSRKREKRGLIVALYITIFIILSALYVQYIYPYWQYHGYRIDIDATKIIVGCFFVVCFALAVPSRTNARSFYLHFLLLTLFLPAMVLFSVGGESIGSASIFVMAMSIVFVASALPIQRFVMLSLSHRLLILFLLLSSIILTISYIYFDGARSFNLNFEEVYDFRREAASTPAIFSYLSSIFSKSVITFGMALALHQRRYYTCAVFFFLSVLIFGFTSHKGVIFYPVLVLFCYVFLTRWIRYRYLLLAFIGALLVSFGDLALQSFTNNGLAGWYNSLFLRRSLMVPAFLDYRYIEYFSENAHYFWSTSRFGLGLVASPYELPPARHMGLVLFGSADSSANTGFVGSGFAQAGLIGVATYALGVGLLIAIVQAYARRWGAAVVVAATIGPMSSMTATDFPTLFLTHGVLVMLLLLAITRRPEAGSSWQRTVALPAQGAK